MNLGEFLNASFKDIGVSIEDGALKELVTKVATMDISDDLVTKFNQNYLTEQAAKANPRIIGHFKAQLYNGLDDELKPLYDELEIPDDIKSELSSINSSTKRASALVRKVKELTEKKAGASKGEKGELNDQITALNNQIKEINKVRQEEIQKLQSEHNGKLDDLYMSQFLGTQKYANELIAGQNFLLPKSEIDKALKEKGLIRKLVGNEFILQTEQGTDYFEANTKVDFKSFGQKVLADKKYLAVTEPPKPTQPTTTVTNTGIDRSKASAVAEYDRAIAEAEANQ